MDPYLYLDRDTWVHRLDRHNRRHGPGLTVVVVDLYGIAPAPDLLAVGQGEAAKYLVLVVVVIVQ